MKKYEKILRAADIMLIPPILYTFIEKDPWLFWVGLTPCAILGIIGIIEYNKLPADERVAPKYFVLPGPIIDIHPYVHGGWFIVLWFFALGILIWRKIYLGVY